MQIGLDVHERLTVGELNKAGRLKKGDLRGRQIRSCGISRPRVDASSERLGCHRPLGVDNNRRHQTVTQRRLCVSKHHRGWDMAEIDFKQFSDAESRSFNAGDTIFRAGDAASELFVIQSGTVQISIDDRVVETLSEHGIFGEMALIDDAPRNATAVALTDVKLVPVEQKQFLFMITQTPYFALNVMRVLARRLRISNQPA
jgi:CRP/FNR family cyclic AMP-dependent transcriptional regulator